MSVALLPNQLANGRLQVRVAWGADLSADPATWTWTDVTTDVMVDNGGIISITVGRGNEATVAQPATCTFRLKNQTGAYTPASPTATNYPNVRLGTPVQVRVSLDGGSTWSVRFQGEAASWSPGWDAQGRKAYVALAASGRTRRLGQGSKPLKSAAYRAASAAGPGIYFPLEDAAGATQASSAVGGGPLGIVGPVQFGETAVAFPGSAGAVDLRGNATDGGGLLLGDLTSTGFSASGWQVEVIARLATTTPSTTPVFVAIGTTGTNEIDLATPAALADGQPHHLSYQFTQSGPNLQEDVYIDGVFDHTTTFPGVTLGLPRFLFLGKTGYLTNDMPLLCHFAILPTLTSPASRAGAATAYIGETADARTARLCAEEKIPLTVIGGPSNMTMGPQGIDTLINHLRECEAVDLGYLLDGLGPGLTYVCRSSIYNEAAQVTINANSGQVPAAGPQPTNDDLRLLNRVTITRVNGSSAVVEDTNGPLGTAAVGVFDSRFVVNSQSDGQLDDIASWIVHGHTVEGMRYPLIPLDFMAAPELASSWAAAVPTDRIDVTNLGSQLTQHPAGTVSLLAEGWTEALNSRQWKVTASCSAFRPWEVFQIQDARLGRIETDGSALSGGPYASNATSLTVTSTNTPWDTTATPFDVDVAGEQVTVTTVTGSTSPQTFTVTRSVNGVVKAQSSGATVKLWKPGVLAL